MKISFSGKCPSGVSHSGIFYNDYPIKASKRRDFHNRMQAKHSLRTAEHPANHDPLRGRTFSSGEGAREAAGWFLFNPLRVERETVVIFPALRLSACTGLCKFSPIRGYRQCCFDCITV
jgi:hypothetical protein